MCSTLDLPTAITVLFTVQEMLLAAGPINLFIACATPITQPFFMMPKKEKHVIL